MAEVPQGASGLTGLDSGGTWAAGTATLLRTEWAKHPRRCLEENLDHASDMPSQRSSRGSPRVVVASHLRPAATPSLTARSPHARCTGPLFRRAQGVVLLQLQTFDSTRYAIASPGDMAPKRRRGEAHRPPTRGRVQGPPTAPAPKDAAAGKEAARVKKANGVCLKCGVRGHYKYGCPSAKFILKQTDGAAPRLLSFKQAHWSGKQAAFDTTRTYDTIESLPAEGKQ